MLLRCSAWPALQAATAPLLVAFLSGMLFIGPHGLTIAEIGQLAEDYSGVRVGVLLLWSLAMAPAARLALGAPGLRYLRWLPAPTWWSIAHFILVVTLLHSPIALLLLVAGKPALAMALLLAGVGLGGGLLLPSYRRWQSLLGLLLVGGILGTAASGDLWIMAGLGLLSGIYQLPRAWRRSAQPSRRHGRRALFGGARVVVVVAQLLRLWRRESALLLRCGLFLVAGAGLLLLLCNANAKLGIAKLTLPVLVASTPCFAMITTNLATGLRKGEEELHWLSASSGVSVSRLLGSSLFLLFVGSGLTALMLAAVALRSTATSLAEGSTLLVFLVVHGVYWAAASSFIAHRSAGDDSRPAAMALVLAFSDMLVLGIAGPWVLVAQLSLVVLFLPSLLGAKRRGEPRRA